MPGGVTRVGDAVTTNDLCQPATTIAPPGEVTVLVEGKPCARLGDLTAPYLSGVPPVCVSLTKPIVGPGVPSVLVGKKPISVLGDTIAPGSGVGVIASSSLTVLAGTGGV